MISCEQILTPSPTPCAACHKPTSTVWRVWDGQQYCYKCFYPRLGAYCEDPPEQDRKQGPCQNCGTRLAESLERSPQGRLECPECIKWYSAHGAYRPEYEEILRVENKLLKDGRVEKMCPRCFAKGVDDFRLTDCGIEMCDKCSQWYREV